MQTINERIYILLKELNVTRTSFAETLKVSQQYISKLIKTGTPSDMLIGNICDKYNVNENWLRTGQGDIFVKRSRNQIIADFAADIIKEDDNFKKRLFEALAQLDENEWELLKKIAEKFVTEKEKE